MFKSKLDIRYIISLIIIHFFISSSSQSIVSNQKYTIGSSVITYHTTCYGKSESNILFLNIHENENTSILAAKQVLKGTNYCFSELQFKKKRFVTFLFAGKKMIVDPNRIFTPKGTLISLKQNNGNYTDKIFNAAGKLINRLAENYTNNYINNKQLIVALHNNANGEPLSIFTYKSGNQAKNASELYINMQKDPDDFFLTTEKAFFDFLKQKGFNVILQDNDHVEDDGSLSVYAAKKNIPYINVEAQMGHLAEQKKMISAVLDLIREKCL